MKKCMYVLLMALIPALIFGSCKKNESGNNLISLIGLGGGSTSAVQGTFVKEVIASAGASLSSSMWGTDAKCRYMMMLPASDIKGSGWINSISFKYNAAPGASRTFAGVSIRMGHTSLTTMSSTYASNVEQGKGTFATVLASQSVTIPDGTAGTYFTIPLGTPFYYNGVDNLIVEVNRNAVLPTAGGVQVTTHTEDGVNNYTVYNTGDAAAASGTPALTYPDVKLNFAGGDNRIYYGTGGNALPFWTDTDYQRVQMLYKASQINGSGGITGIAFTIAGTNLASQDYTVTVRLGHTTLDELGSSSWSANFNSGAPVTVADAAVFSVLPNTPVGTDVWLPLTGSFTYNGTSNLIVDITVDSATSLTSFMTDSSGTNTRLCGSSTAPAAIAPLDNTRYNIKLRFRGGSADVITAGSTEDLYPFNDSFNNIVQYLYRSGELGTSGTVTGIALRLSSPSPSVSITYNGFAVVMGHTANTQLGSTFASNMTDATTVYSGTFSMPAGLKTGDWIEIPLTTHFTYNAGNNLTVQLSAHAGTVTHGTELELNNTLYINRHSYASDNTAVTATGINNHLADFRLIFQ